MVPSAAVGSPSGARNASMRSAAAFARRSRQARSTTIAGNGSCLSRMKVSAASTAADGTIDLAAWIFDPDGLGPWLANRDEVLPHMARRLGPAAPHWAAGGGRSETGDDAPLPPVLSLEIAKDGVAVRLFSTITTLGEPQDLALHDIRIESFFPADEASRAVLEAMAG